MPEALCWEGFSLDVSPERVEFLMTTVTVEEAQAKLPELLEGLARGEELTVTRAGRVVARIVGERSEPRPRPGPGLAKGMITIVADDDEHLADFAGYMP